MGRDLTKLPVFSREHANCATCELSPQCDRGMTAHAYRPKDFNGLMVVGEGPDSQEVAEDRPFVGPSGKLVRAMLKQSGIDFDRCFITNATIGKPKPHKKTFTKDFPNAIPSCLPRLEAEIAAVRPSVILVLGGPALIAITGYDKPKTIRTPLECDKCNEHRKVGPVLECSAPFNGGACGHLHYFKAKSKEEVDPQAYLMVKEAGCPKCGARFKNVRPKMIKCPTCGGRKFQHTDTTEFIWDYNITDVAGAIFTPAARDAPREAHNVGHWFAEQGVQYVVGSYHPAFILRDQQFLAEAGLKHFAKVKRLLDGVKPSYQLNYEVTKDPAVVRAFHAKLKKEKRSPTVDIETEPKLDADGKALDATFPPDVGKIQIVGLGDEVSQLVVDTRDCNPNDPSDPLLAALADFLCDDQMPKCWHNGASYDIPTLDLAWGVPAAAQITSYEDDTRSQHTELYPDEPHKLAHVAFSFTDAYAWKPARRVKGVEVHESFEDRCLYNARDVYNTARSRTVMSREIPTHKLQRVDEIDREIRRIAVEMTMAGLPVNLEIRKQFVDAAEAKAKQAHIDTLKPLWELNIIPEIDPYGPRAKDAFNPLSNPQLQWLLFSKDGFGLKPLSFTDEGAPQTNEATIYALHASVKDPSVQSFLTNFLTLRRETKTISTFLASHEAQPWYDGRVHSFWQPWGTRTGRFSSKDINQTNQPKWLRAMYEAGPGRVIVGADEDQLELRAVAVLAGDPVLTHKCMTADDQRKLEPECDPHSFVASLAFGNVYTALHLKDPTHDKKNTKCPCQTCKRKALRDLIKRVIYGLNYGSGDETVRKAIYAKGDYNGPPIDLPMIAHVRKTVFNTFSAIPPWREEIVAQAQATSELRSPLHGRRRVFPLNEISVTEAYNFPIQSVAADLMNEMLIELRKRLADADPSAFIVAQVHDAIYVEASEDRGDAVAKLMGEVMTRELVLREGAPAMMFTASGSVAKNWKDAA